MEAEFVVLNEDESLMDHEEEWAIQAGFYGVEVFHHHEPNPEPEGLIGRFFFHGSAPWTRCGPGVGDASRRRPSKQVVLGPCSECGEGIPENVADIAQDLSYLKL